MHCTLAMTALLAVANPPAATNTPAAKEAGQPAAAAPAKPAEATLGLKVGDKVTDAELTSATGEKVKLASLLGKGPVVVVFYRGGWCPFCNKALKAWQSELKNLEAEGATLVAIAPEGPEHVTKTVEKDGVTFRVFCDSKMEAAKGFKVAFDMDADTQKKYQGYGLDLSKTNASGEWKLPHPGTFVIDRDSVVRAAWVDANYTMRVEPAKVIEAVKALKK